MAKSFMKKAKKAVKSAKKEVKSVSAGVKEAVKEVKSEASSSARKHIESLSKSRRDAAVMWGMIQNGNHSTAEIKEICKEKGFSQLLSEIS